MSSADQIWNKNPSFCGPYKMFAFWERKKKEFLDSCSGVKGVEILFRVIFQNKGIHNRLEAWLVFLSVDDPEWIERFIRECREFRVMYGEVYELCRNLEEIMGMYSKELQKKWIPLSASKLKRILITGGCWTTEYRRIGKEACFLKFEF